jgi:hypothetical protein
MSRICYERYPAAPDAVRILSRRRLLTRNYKCLLGELRSHRRAARVFNRNPSASALAAVGQRQRRLDTIVSRYLRTLSELRGAVENVYPAG